MNNYDWTDRFSKLYAKALKQYGAGNREPSRYFDREELDFLASIGCRPMELYDFAEDAPELSYETALLIAAARRDFFLTVQHGRWSDQTLAEKNFPPKKEALDGIEWLPRIILKAKARLRGELPANLMYCCGGDRAFLKKHNIHPSDFLRVVWSAGDDDSKILAAVKAGGTDGRQTP